MDRHLIPFLRKYSKLSHPVVDTHIHDDDEMFQSDGGTPETTRMNYFRLGSELTRTILQIASWRFGDQVDQIAFLEFPCGHGRNVRHLVHCLPRRNIFVSDIYESGVEFNVQRFGVRGRVSVHDPSELHWPERFDMIVVPSLFSHLPESTFGRWITALHGHLSDRGIMVFSVHGDHLLGENARRPESGLHFSAESESKTLAKQEYGTTVVTRDYVAGQIRNATGLRSYSYTKRGFWNHQDSYIIGKTEDVECESFRYDYGLLGYLDKLTVSPEGQLELSGWAKDSANTRNQVRRVRALIDGEVVAECDSSFARQDVANCWNENFLYAGFRLVLPRIHEVKQDGILEVETVSRGIRDCVFSLPLQVALRELAHGQDTMGRPNVWRFQPYFTKLRRKAWTAIRGESHHFS